MRGLMLRPRLRLFSCFPRLRCGEGATRVGRGSDCGPPSRPRWRGATAWPIGPLPGTLGAQQSHFQQLAEDPAAQFMYVKSKSTAQLVREHCVGTRFLLLMLVDMLHRRQTPKQTRPLVWEVLQRLVSFAVGAVEGGIPCICNWKVLLGPLTLQWLLQLLAL